MAHARAAKDVGWGETEVPAPHGADTTGEDPAHRPISFSRVPTAASRSSFTALRKTITSRARTVSTAGTASALERDRLEVGVIAANLDADLVQTFNLKPLGLFWAGYAKMHCLVKHTDVMWGETTHRTPALRAEQAMEWHKPPHFDFIRMPGSADPMLLTVQLVVTEIGSENKVGSVSLDLRDDQVGRDDAAQWHQLVSDDGVNAQGRILLQVIKGRVSIVEIMKKRRERQIRFTTALLVCAAVLASVLYIFLAPRFCDAKCRGAWRSEASMSESRVDFAAAVYRDTIVLLGGRSLKSVESLDLATARWRPETSMAETRGRFGAGVLKDRLIAVGGVGRLTVEAFNGSLDKLLDSTVPFSPLPQIQADIGAVNFRNDSLCIVGRSGGSGVVAPSVGASFMYSMNILCITNGTSRLKTNLYSERISLLRSNVDFLVSTKISTCKSSLLLQTYFLAIRSHTDSRLRAVSGKRPQ